MVPNILRNEIRKSSLSEIQRKLRYFPNISNNFPRENPRNPFLEHVFIRFSVNRWQKICIFFYCETFRFSMEKQSGWRPFNLLGKIVISSCILDFTNGNWKLLSKKSEKYDSYEAWPTKNSLCHSWTFLHY